MTSKLTILLALFGGSFLLGACGQKGPLYLPGSPSTLSTPVPVPTEETGNEEDDEAQEDEQSGTSTGN